MRNPPARYISSVFLLVCLCAGAQAQRGALTLDRGIDELTDEAAVVVRGHVREAHLEPHPQLKNLMTVVVTINVDKTLKGSSDKTLTFRQYVWDIRDKADAMGYGKSQELILMLGPVSQYGMTSPVGLEQGRFRVIRDSNGNASAINGRRNAGLFASLERRAKAKGIALPSRSAQLARTSNPGPVPLDDLEEVIRTFAKEKK
jgi:hypothetical protein